VQFLKKCSFKKNVNFFEKKGQMICLKYGLENALYKGLDDACTGVILDRSLVDEMEEVIMVSPMFGPSLAGIDTRDVATGCDLCDGKFDNRGDKEAHMVVAHKDQVQKKEKMEFRLC
jgi:hypothetical protein